MRVTVRRYEDGQAQLTVQKGWREGGGAKSKVYTSLKALKANGKELIEGWASEVSQDISPGS